MAAMKKSKFMSRVAIKFLPRLFHSRYANKFPSNRYFMNFLLHQRRFSVLELNLTAAASERSDQEKIEI